MVGFTSFSERSGEEATYTLMRGLSKLMEETVREQGGIVRGFTEDGPRVPLVEFQEMSRPQ
jgi:class 3 adenylate cyclase